MKLKECPICLEDMWLRKTLRCGHSYHKKCINMALAVKQMCPLCRASSCEPCEPCEERSRGGASRVSGPLDQLTVEDQAEIVEKCIQEAASPGVLFPHINMRVVISYFINRGNILCLSYLLEHCRVNFHATFRGRTINEEVLECSDERVRQLFSGYIEVPSVRPPLFNPTKPPVPKRRELGARSRTDRARIPIKRRAPQPPAARVLPSAPKMSEI